LSFSIYSEFESSDLSIILITRFGWSHPENADGTGERFVAVLEIPPVDSPGTAVKIVIYSDIKKGKI
jgi:hypothetical protein